MGIFQLLSIQNDVVIAQDHDKQYTWREIKTLIAGVQHQLLLSKAKSCAILSNDSTEFIAGFIACSYLGIDILLPPNDSQQMIQSLDADVYLGSFDKSIKIIPSKQDIINQSIDSNVIIFTSGSTGKPKKINRKLTQLFKEVEEIDRMWGNTFGSNIFASTVSYQHIYGLLFSILWPLKKSQIIWNKILPFEESLQTLTHKFEKITLISSPAFLKRISDQNTEFIGQMQVYCSGGALTKGQHKTASAKLSSHITQVYGSTETGGIAYKYLNNNWQFFPSVQHKIGNNILFVKSPFCYRDQWQNTNDIISMKDGGFTLLGRADRIVKIEEKRVSLIQVENTITQHKFVKESHIIAIHKQRQYLAAIIVLNTHGKEVLKQHTEKDMKKTIKSFLRDQIEKLAIPRQIRFLDEIPTNAQGKLLHHQIESLFI